MRLYRTSVKEDINICNVFQHLAENYVNQVKSSVMQQQQQHRGYGRADVVDSSSASSSSGCSSSSSPPLSLLQIGGSHNHLSYHNHRSSIGQPTSDTYHGFTTPQEYLDNPMFASLNSRKKRKQYNWLSAADRTIVLKPLSQLTKKRATSVQHRPMRGACRVL